MKAWSEWEDNFLKLNYLKLTRREMGERLGRTKASVGNRMRLLKLKRGVNPGYFKKGQRSWNKGVSYTAPGSEKGWFKKGHIPKNTKFDGAISIRRDKRGVAYKHIRVELGVWEPLHRVVWREHNGEIPGDSVIRFVNGDTLDCSIDNLELVSKADNARLNENRKKQSETHTKIRRAFKDLENDSFVAWLITQDRAKAAELVRVAPDLIELKRAQLKLNRSINYAKEG